MHADGVEWVVDAAGCRPEALRDRAVVRAVCERVLTELELQVIGNGVWHQFPAPGGITGLYLLTESHLTCHTFPEFGSATFNLYCCRRRHTWLWEDRLREMLGAASVSVRSLNRVIVANAYDEAPKGVSS